MPHFAPLLGYALAVFFTVAAGLALWHGFVYIMIPYLVLAVGIGSAAHEAARVE